MNKNLLKATIFTGNNETELIIKAITTNLSHSSFHYEILDFNFNHFVETEQTTENRLIEVEKEFPYINTIKCKFCRKCLEYCNYNAITFFQEIPTVMINKKNCMSCFVCEKKCNISAIKRKNHQIGYLMKLTLSDNLTYLKGYLKNENHHYITLLSNLLALSDLYHIKIGLFNLKNPNITKKIINLSDKIILLQKEKEFNSDNYNSDILEKNRKKIIYINSDNFITNFNKILTE